jgi:hypothetical protein
MRYGRLEFVPASGAGVIGAAAPWRQPRTFTQNMKVFLDKKL